jgi:type VI protein secretion system component Hcp
MPDILIDVGDTTNFEGECEINGFEKFIVCDSFSVGAHQPLDHGRGTNRTGGTMNLSEVAMNRQFDKTSVPLLNAMFTAHLFPTVKIHFLKASGVDNMGHDEYLTVELDNVLIGNIQTHGGGGNGHLSESLSFGFTKIQYTYKVQEDSTAKLNGQLVASFDMYKHQSTKG